jgi:hypothetical protein
MSLSICRKSSYLLMEYQPHTLTLSEITSLHAYSFSRRRARGHTFLRTPCITTPSTGMSRPPMNALKFLSLAPDSSFSSIDLHISIVNGVTMVYSLCVDEDVSYLAITGEADLFVMNSARESLFIRPGVVSVGLTASLLTDMLS